MLKVLIVDDEAVVRRGIVLGIDWASLGCAVVGEAANGEEGLAAAERYSPNLIITDVRMPHMDGIEMMRVLRERGSTAHVIVLTAYNDFDYARSALRFGAADYLLKPFRDQELVAAIERVRTPDFAASRGEYLNGKVIAAYLGFPFVDAAEVIFFQPDGSLNDEKTESVLRERLSTLEHAVVPGFYGCGADGYVKTFSRGGSDITGALAAAALGADVYENWTDVSGILMADPRIVDDPEPIRRVTYSELRELSYIGAQVLHEGTIFPVREKNIPLNIRNTNAPDHPGTMILESIEDEQKEGGFITGIAGKKGFSIITIAKTGMSSEPGTLLKILNVLAKHEVNVEYLPSGIDNVSLVVSSDKVSRSLYEMLGELQKEVQPNKITVTEHIAIVAAVGRKMAYQPGVSGKIFAKLGENGVNIRMITQGPEELNIIVGVEEKNFEQAIRVLYNSFVKENVV